MSEFNRIRSPSAAPDVRADMSLDAGLRAFMLGVYNKVALGLLVSAALAFLTSSVPAVRDLLFVTTSDGRLAGITALGMIVAFSPLVVLLVAMFAMRSPTARGTGLLYWTVVALIGASLGAVVLAYTGASIASTFLITAAAFGGLSLFGYVTRRDLSGLGSFLLVGLIGLILASVVNLFLRSSMTAFVINVAGVLIFAGLIAYDTQRLKLAYYGLADDPRGLGVATNYGALSLYINFINLFQFLLALMGQRR